MRNHFQAQRKGEVFPIASLLLSSQVRNDVLAFYDMVRGCDAIADDATASADERESRLHAAFHAREGWALPYWKAVASGRINPAHAQAMLLAFQQDCRKTRYASWQELLDYCRHSAVPVGRFMLGRCGEAHADLEASDALCTLLQILNHLRDIKPDYTQLQRIYLPQDLCAVYGVNEAMLGMQAESAALSQLKADLLSRCRLLQEQASSLPQSIAQRRLRWQLHWVIAVAKAWHRALAQQDVLRVRVQPSLMHLAGVLFHE